MKRLEGSFRDPSGFVFSYGKRFYRQINPCYKQPYDHFMASGLYEKLVSAKLLVSHEEVDNLPVDPAECYKTIRPDVIPFISYPYEWCYSQLKNAALATLKIQKIALDHDMVLKDASAYNIQFYGGHPVLLDTLSFDTYRAGAPWVAYRQFCQHFLAPLALMSYRDVRLGQLLRTYIDGIPLDLASRLLPFRSRCDLSLLTHIHLHASSQKRYGSKPIDIHKMKVSKYSLRGLIDHLESSVQSLKWEPGNTEWADYYENSAYSQESIDHKTQIVDGFIEKIRPNAVWDFGANNGFYSRIPARKGIPTVSYDLDPVAVEKNYRQCVKTNEPNLLPLLMDLTNPSSGNGWDNQERMSLYERGPAEMVITLALIHHLVITNNIPFSYLSKFFAKYCHWLVIEFVPRSDGRVQRLFSRRNDSVEEYTDTNFKTEFANRFEILDAVTIRGSERQIYLMKNRAVN